VDAPETALEQRLELHGLLCLSDPLREEVPNAVARCKDAGIRVILVTGDHPDTARAVAGLAGILSRDAGADAVLTGDQLERLRESELVERVRGGLNVFARTTPEQKLKIVGAVKRMGLLVAMTGDGVNDAPALRAADVGIAMGAAGTDVAREAAQIVLLDDDFTSIVAGVEEGRTIFANMRKFTSYVLASNVPEMVPFLAYVALPVPLGLTVLQILCIDLGSNLLPAIALGEEPPDGEAMKRPPRGRSGRLLDTKLLLRSYVFLGLLEAAWAMFMFFLVLHLGGWRYGQILSAASRSSSPSRLRCSTGRPSARCSRRGQWRRGSSPSRLWARRSCSCPIWRASAWRGRLRVVPRDGPELIYAPPQLGRQQGDPPPSSRLSWSPAIGLIRTIHSTGISWPFSIGLYFTFLNKQLATSSGVMARIQAQAPPLRQSLQSLSMTRKSAFSPRGAHLLGCIGRMGG
jgi:phosphoserine phosphatase